MISISNHIAEDFGQKLTLSCKCIVPKWRLFENRLICDTCKTSVTINRQLQELIQPDFEEKTVTNQSRELVYIREALNSIQNTVGYAHRFASENEQLHSMIADKDEQIAKLNKRIRQTDLSTGYLQERQESLDSLDVPSIIRAVLVCISKTENDCVEIKDDIDLLLNHIENNIYELKDKLEECGLELTVHKPGDTIRPDENILVDPSYENTGDKSLNGIVKKSDCVGCVFPNDVYGRIREKITIWNYSPKMDKTAIPATIVLHSNNDGYEEIKEMEMFVGDVLNLSSYDEVFTPQEHYHLVGWSLSDESDQLQNSPIKIAGDTHLYATWSNKHKMRFICELPEETREIVKEIGYGETVDVPVMDGYVPLTDSVSSTTDEDETCVVKYCESSSCRVCNKSSKIELLLLHNKCVIQDIGFIPYDSTLDIRGLVPEHNNSQSFAVVSVREVNSITFDYKDDNDCIHILMEYERGTKSNQIPSEYSTLENKEKEFDLGNIKVNLNQRDIVFPGIRYDFESWGLTHTPSSVCVDIRYNKMYRVSWSLPTGSKDYRYYKCGSIPMYDKEIVISADKNRKRAYFFTGWIPAITELTQNTEYLANILEDDYRGAIRLAIEHGCNTFDKLKKRLKIPEEDMALELSELSKDGIILRKENKKKRKTSGTKKEGDLEDNPVEDAKKYTYRINV